jgi:hypothetical protein
MLSLNSAVQTALAIKKVPAFTQGSIRDLAQQLGMAFPISVRDLITVLGGLRPASVTFDSGRIVADNVHASAYLFLQSDGGMSFGGQVHESGVFGDNFTIAMALLDVRDASGRVLVFAHSDTIVGQLGIGFSNKEWHQYGFNQFVRDNWSAVKHSRVETRLHVSTDPWQVAEIALGFSLGAVFIGSIFSSRWDCGWAPSNDPNAERFGGNPNDHPPNESVSVYECVQKDK